MGRNRPVDMPDNLPKTPKPDINRPTPKTIPVDWPHPAPSGPKPHPATHEDEVDRCAPPPIRRRSTAAPGYVWHRAREGGSGRSYSARSFFHHEM
jgi:hypothetical protein